jgi:hypothetical protein
MQSDNTADASCADASGRNLHFHVDKPFLVAWYPKRFSPAVQDGELHRLSDDWLDRTTGVDLKTKRWSCELREKGGFKL